MNISESRLEAQDLNKQGELLLKVGNLAQAEAKFQAAIDVDPMVMDSYKNYGDLCMAKEDYKEAKNYYKKAILVEKNGQLYFLYGNACFMNDEMHEGLGYYNMAISEGYDTDEMLFFMGMAYEHMNDYQMAYRYFQKAYAKNPSRPDYLVKKIGSLVKLDMIEEAEESTDELLSIAPEYFDGYHIKIQLLIHKNDYVEAIKFAEAATARFPEDVDLVLDLVRSCAMNQEFDRAITLIENAKKMKYFEESKRAFTILEAEIYAEKNDYDSAMKCCNECISMEDEDNYAGEARFMLMNLYLAKPDYALACDMATQLVQADKEDVYYFAALYYKAFCNKHLGNDEEATRLFKEANSIYRLETLKKPAAIDIYLYRVMCLKDLEQYDKALELLEFIEGISDKIAEVYTLRADIYNKMGRKSLADENLEKAYKLKPELKPSNESVGD